MRLSYPRLVPRRFLPASPPSLANRCLASWTARVPGIASAHATDCVLPNTLKRQSVRQARRGEHVSVGIALLTIAVGAILRFAVTASLGGIDVGTVGVILMVVGVVGLVIGLGTLVANGGSGDGTV